MYDISHCILAVCFGQNSSTMYVTILFLQDVLWETSSEEGESVEEEGQEGEGEEGGSGVKRSGKAASGVVDVEDMGRVLHKARVSRASRGLVIRKRAEPREMVTPLLKKNLSKQGMYSCTLMYTHT